MSESQKKFNDNVAHSSSKSNSSNGWLSRWTNMSSLKSDEAKKIYLKLTNEIKQFQEHNSRKNKRNSLTEREHREKFLSESLELWMNFIIPYWTCFGEIPRDEKSHVGKLWWNGLPPKIRGQVWKLSIGNELNITEEVFKGLESIARTKLKDTKQVKSKGKVKLQLERDKDFESSLNYNDTSQAYFKFIELDVSRTFPQLGLFQIGAPYYENLQLLLSSYIYFSHDIGYVQGQAFVGAMFLLNLDLFDSFICFTNLLNRRYFQRLYRFKSIDQYFQLLKDLLVVHLPKLSEHFSKMSIEINCFALDWLFTMFSKSLPLDIVVRIWDLILRDGDTMIFRTAIGILSIFEEDLCRLDTFYCLQYLTRLPENMDEKKLFDAIERIQLRRTDSNLYHLIA